jgi:hypothetical protein
VREDFVHLRNLGIIAAIGATTVFGGGNAEAQGFFDFFGFGRRPAPPPQVQPYAPPGFDEGAPVERRAESTPSATYCVRLCDGRFFPIQRAGGNPAESCNSFCPAAKTMVFSGSGIEHAVSTNGKRYADLENAFTYRDKVVENCSCNGRTAHGLSRLDISRDPTLRPGDIVATSEGMATYNGKAKGVAQFTPIDKGKVSSEMRSRLANMRIQQEFNGEDRTASDASAQSSETTGAPAASERREKRTQR